jgi:NADPH:quinone reductase-like Zn-dependent oxidoreductase
MADEGLQLRSEVTAGGELKVSLVRVPVPDPAPDEVVVRIEATPINPSDLGLLLGPVDPATLKASGSADSPAVTGRVPEAAMRAMAGRLDQSLPVGNEGAGVVVKAGGSPEARALMGKAVAILGGAMYAEFRTMKAADCLVLPPDATPADGASCFVNPLTALCMVECMRMEGHTALVHTAAASNLGQMLNRICLDDGVPLVNIVRSPAQVELLRAAGAKWVCDSSQPGFMAELIAALQATGATLAFDAIGGGRLASQILTGMEAVASAKAGAYSRYGSSVHKQVYIYGGLDTGPTELYRSYGMAWGLGGFLLTPFLQKLGPGGFQRLRDRVAAELKTTFASRYSRVISLRQALDPAIIVEYARRATGEKVLINPRL